MMTPDPSRDRGGEKLVNRSTATTKAFGTIAVVGFYAVAMAWVEAACVVYLRTLVHRLDPYQATPMPAVDFPAATELVREAATLVMLASVGWLAGRSWRSRFGSFALAFGVWDIFYYLFLRILVGWPQTFFDWDVLFLLPLPWWGPVLAPILISVLLIALGSFMTVQDLDGSSPRARRLYWVGFFAGILLALYVFMEQSIRDVAQGGKGLAELVPTRFNWILFALAMAMLSGPIWGMLRQAVPGPPDRPAPPDSAGPPSSTTGTSAA